MTHQVYKGYKPSKQDDKNGTTHIPLFDNLPDIPKSSKKRKITTPPPHKIDTDLLLSETNDHIEKDKHDRDDMIKSTNNNNNNDNISSILHDTINDNNEKKESKAMKSDTITFDDIKKIVLEQQEFINIYGDSIDELDKQVEKSKYQIETLEFENTLLRKCISLNPRMKKLFEETKFDTLKDDKSNGQISKKQVKSKIDKKVPFPELDTMSTKKKDNKQSSKQIVSPKKTIDQDDNKSNKKNKKKVVVDESLLSDNDDVDDDDDKDDNDDKRKKPIKKKQDNTKDKPKVVSPKSTTPKNKTNTKNKTEKQQSTPKSTKKKQDKIIDDDKEGDDEESSKKKNNTKSKQQQAKPLKKTTSKKQNDVENKSNVSKKRKRSNDDSDEDDDTNTKSGETRVCKECGETRPLNKKHFELKRDKYTVSSGEVRESMRFLHICRDCRNRKRRESRNDAK